MRLKNLSVVAYISYFNVKIEKQNFWPEILEMHKDFMNAPYINVLDSLDKTLVTHIGGIHLKTYDPEITVFFRKRKTI